MEKTNNQKCRKYNEAQTVCHILLFLKGVHYQLHTANISIYV